MIKNITSDIKYVGVDDLDLDLFESQYIIPNGISYNSYIIEDEQIAIMDSVDARKCDEWLTNLAEVLGERQPDLLVVQHMEPDHAGSIATVMERYPSLKIVATARAVQMLPQFFEECNFEGRTMAVKEGETLSLGHHTLQFLTAPMTQQIRCSSRQMPLVSSGRCATRRSGRARLVATTSISVVSMEHRCRLCSRKRLLSI